VNKTDLVSEEILDKLKKHLPREHSLFISALSEADGGKILNELKKHTDLSGLTDGDQVITNLRHFEALEGAGTALQRVMEGINNNLSEDLLSQDIRECLHYIGEITGEITTDEVLGNIFRNFCIGK
jgi:tRNA modification GTPase